jgi:hypothetical protein
MTMNETHKSHFFGLAGICAAEMTLLSAAACADGVAPAIHVQQSSTSQATPSSMATLREYNIVSMIGKGSVVQQDASESGTGGSGTIGINLRNYVTEWNVNLNTSSAFPEVDAGAFKSAVISPSSVGYSAYLDASFLPFRAYDGDEDINENLAVSLLKKSGFFGSLSLNPSVWAPDSLDRKQMLIVQSDVGVQFLPYSNDSSTVKADPATNAVSLDGNISVSLGGGFTTRVLTGDAGQDKAFLYKVIGTRRNFYYGYLLKSLVRYNGIALSVSYVYFPKKDKNIDGLTGGQIITSFSVSNAFITKITKRKNPYGRI